MAFNETINNIVNAEELEVFALVKKKKHTHLWAAMLLGFIALIVEIPTSFL